MTQQVLHIGKGWFPEETGGLDRYYYDLVGKLPAAGVAVDGLVTGSARVARESGGAVRAFAPTRSSLPTRWKGVRQEARRSLARGEISLVAAHFALYAAPCLDLFGKAPMVVHFQGPWAAESRVEGASAFAAGLKRQLESAVYRRARTCITLSRAFARVLVEDYRIPAERIVTIPGGVDVDRWQTPLSRAEARRQLGWPCDRPIVFAARRLARRMGLEQLIGAVALARREVPEILVQVAGKGPLAAELEERSRTAGVDDAFKLLGYLPDHLLPLAYRAADLTVVPSVALEGFGLVVVESIAAGTPALVSDAGGLPETVEGFAPQCVVRDGTPAAWGRAIAAACRGELSLPDSASLQRTAHQLFDWSTVMPKVVATYQEAMT